MNLEPKASIWKLAWARCTACKEKHTVVKIFTEFYIQQMWLWKTKLWKTCLFSWISWAYENFCPCTKFWFKRIFLFRGKQTGPEKHAFKYTLIPHKKKKKKEKKVSHKCLYFAINRWLCNKSISNVVYGCFN